MLAACLKAGMYRVFASSWSAVQMIDESNDCVKSLAWRRAPLLDHVRLAPGFGGILVAFEATSSRRSGWNRTAISVKLVPAGSLGMTKLSPTVMDSCRGSV